MMNDMDIVQFLEDRTSEQEAALRAGAFTFGSSTNPADGSEDNATVQERMLEECAQQRALIASWKESAAAEGITDPDEATDTIAIARRTMLVLLAGAHRDHPDYNPDWDPEPPTIGPGDPSRG